MSAPLATMPPSTRSSVERESGVRVHRIEHLAGLERGRLEGGAGDVALVREAGEADDDAAGIRSPVRREEPGERRHEVDAAVVVDRERELLDVRSLLDDAEVVAQPLDERAGHGDRPLERVDRIGRRRAGRRPS